MLKGKIDRYLESKRSAWAPSTWKSEASRLKALGDLIDQDPASVFEALQAQGMKLYSIKTLFIRLSDFERWADAEKRFTSYLRTHKNRFKHAYVKEEIAITYEEAQKRIAALEEPYRSMAEGMLKTGVRISEAYTVRDGRVVGKGGKTRKVFGEIRAIAPKHTFWKKLKSIGLKPHTLRKLCATRLAEKGASAADLCKAFGWSEIKTAYQYLQARDDERMQKLFEE